MNTPAEVAEDTKIWGEGANTKMLSIPAVLFSMQNRGWGDMPPRHSRSPVHTNPGVTTKAA